MNAEAEREVTAGISIDVQPVRIVEYSGVPVRDIVGKDEAVTRANRDAGDLDVLERDASSATLRDA